MASAVEPLLRCGVELKRLPVTSRGGAANRHVEEMTHDSIALSEGYPREFAAQVDSLQITIQESFFSFIFSSV